MNERLEGSGDIEVIVMVEWSALKREFGFRAKDGSNCLHMIGVLVILGLSFLYQYAEAWRL